MRLFIQKVLAQTDCSTGNGCLEVRDWYRGDITFNQIADNIQVVLTYAAAPIAIALFTFGAFYYIIFFGNEENKSTGKNLMIGAVVGLAIIVAAKAILNTLLYLLYGGA